MKTKFLSMLALVMTVLISPLSFAGTNPCEGVSPVSIMPSISVSASLQDIIDHYADYPFEDKYRICFPPDIQRIERPLTFTHLPDKEVIISGLNILPYETSFPANSPLFRLSGSNLRLVNSSITCSTNTQIGIAISGPNNTVQGTEISSCSEGIRIEASNTLLGPADASRYAEDKNIIHDNAIGISEVSGMTGNRWAFNSLYGNTVGIQSQKAAPALVLALEPGSQLVIT